MIKQDLIDVSPAKLLKDTTNGGLNPGSMGLVTSKKGLGKTSVLVQIALDCLITGRQVVHVSFDQHSSNVISWYNSVLSEIAKKRNLGDTAALADEIMRERMILNFNQETFSLPKVVKTIKALGEGGITVSLIIIDGADMDKVTTEDLKTIADFAKAEALTVWFSGTNESDSLKDTLTSEREQLFSIVAHLASNGSTVELSILKGGEGKVKLDSKTLLMVK